MKKYLPYLLGAFLLLLAFVGGVGVGGYGVFRITGELFSRDLGEDEYISEHYIHTLLLQMDSGKVDEAQKYMRLREVGHLLALDRMAPYWGSKRQESVCRFMKVVAQRRQAKPELYAEVGDPQINQKLEKILANPAACAKP